MSVNEYCVSCYHYKSGAPYKLVGKCRAHNLETVMGLQTACDDWEPRERQLPLYKGVNIGNERSRVRAR